MVLWHKPWSDDNIWTHRGQTYNFVFIYTFYWVSGHVLLTICNCTKNIDILKLTRHQLCLFKAMIESSPWGSVIIIRSYLYLLYKWPRSHTNWCTALIRIYRYHNVNTSNLCALDYVVEVSVVLYLYSTLSTSSDCFAEEIRLIRHNRITSLGTHIR